MISLQPPTMESGKFSPNHPTSMSQLLGVYRTLGVQIPFCKGIKAFKTMFLVVWGSDFPIVIWHLDLPGMQMEYIYIYIENIAGFVQRSCSMNSRMALYHQRYDSGLESRPASQPFPKASTTIPSNYKYRNHICPIFGYFGPMGHDLTFCYHII